MVSFNVYRSTFSGAYVEGICLATDEKPVVGIANGSILYAVDISTGETTRYMYDQESMSWIEAACPCSGGSGSGGGDSGGGDIMIANGTVNTGSTELAAIDKTWNELKAAYDAGKLCAVKYEFDYTNPQSGVTGSTYKFEFLSQLGKHGAIYFASFTESDLESEDPDVPMRAGNE